MDKVKVLSTDIIPVKGFTRSVLLDLTRENYDFVPNSLYEQLVDNQIDLIDQQLMEWLISKDYLINVPESLKSNFLEISKIWEFPSKILMLTIDSRYIRARGIHEIYDLIEYFNVKSLVINYCYEDLVEEIFIGDLVLLNQSKLDVLEILCNYQSKIDWTLIADEISKIKNIVVYNCPDNGILHCGKDAFANLCKKRDSFEERTLFEQDSAYFNVNTELYTEALSFNTYFNRRLNIDEKGGIKNSFESENTFGNLTQFNSLQEFEIWMDQSEFKKMWGVRKDVCDVCKDCEFRYMCIDNRQPVNRKENEWFLEIECNYNPYICKWRGEEGFLSLSECGVISNNKEFSIDYAILDKIVQELWYKPIIE